MINAGTRIGISNAPLWQRIFIVHYNRIIADGGVVENKSLMQDMIKDLCSCMDKWRNLYTATDACFGYKLGTTDLYGFSHISKLYNITGLGDFSQADIAKQPLLAKWINHNYWFYAGGNTGNVSCSAYQVTGDLDVQALIEHNTGLAANACMIAHTAAAKYTFRFRILNSTTKTFKLYYSLDGTTEDFATSTGITTSSNKYWIRATRNATTGVISFYWSENNETTYEPVSWTHINDVNKTAGSLYSQPTVLIDIGADLQGSSHYWAGKIYKIRLYDAGLLKINFDPNEYNPSVNINSWTSATYNNIFNINLAYVGYAGGVVFRSTVFTDASNDALVANISLPRTPYVYADYKERSTSNYMWSDYNFTSIVQSLGSTTVRNRTSLVLSLNYWGTKGYAHNAIQWFIKKYAVQYYSPSYLNNARYRFTYLKNIFNQIHNWVYGNINNFITRFNSDEKVKILTIGDSTSPLGIYFTYSLSDFKTGSKGIGYTNVGSSTYDPKIVTSSTGSWTETLIGGTNELWGIAGSSMSATTGATLTVTPSSDVFFDIIRIWYAKNTDKGAFDLVCNGVTTHINTNATAALGYTDIAIAEGNHAVLINNITGTVLLYGISLSNSSGIMSYGLCRGGSTTIQWLNHTYMLQYINILNPDLIIIQLGFNDAENSAAVMPSMITLLSQLKANSSCNIILCTSGNKTTDGIMDESGIKANSDVLYANFKVLVDSDNTIATFHLNSAFPVWTTGADYQLYYTGAPNTDDYVHPNSTGTKLQGDMILNGFIGI